MKPSNLSCLFILIGFALVLGGTSEASEPTNPRETEPQSKKTELQQKESAKQQTPSIDRSVNDQPSHSSVNRSTSETQTQKQEAQPPPPSDTWWFNLFVT